MDDEYAKILIKINEYKNEYPNITNIWYTYLINKHKNLLNDIKQCNNVLNNMNNDVNNNDIINILLMKYVINDIHN